MWALFIGIFLTGGGIWGARYLHESDEPPEYFAQVGRRILRSASGLGLFIGIMLLFGVFAGFFK